MKKLVFFVFILFITFITFTDWVSGEEIGENLEYKVIPDEAIRLRILANSNDEADQQLKYLIRDKVNEEVAKWVGDMAEIDAARRVIQDKLPQIEKIIAETVEGAGDGNDFTVEYNREVSFPAKLYGDFLYPPGEYEAILITVGEGKGSNWWCVLFPPLCFLDFSFGTSVDEQQDYIQDETQVEDEEKEVSFFLLEWFRSF